MTSFTIYDVSANSEYRLYLLVDSDGYYLYRSSIDDLISTYFKFGQSSFKKSTKPPSASNVVSTYSPITHPELFI